jgi:hypothetical protein
MRVVNSSPKYNPVAAFALVADKSAKCFVAYREFPNAPLELRTLHSFSFGQMCPKVKGWVRSGPPPPKNI